MSSNSRPSTTTIDDLPDEVLRHIFLNVPMSTTPGKSWVSLRAVCKRWSPILDDCWHEFNELSLFDGYNNLAINYTSRSLVANISKESLRKKTADKLIQYCGPYLKSLEVWTTIPSMMPVAAEKCLRLEQFSGFVKTQSEAKYLRDLLDSCTKLKTLKIELTAKKAYCFFQRIPTHQLEELSILTNGNSDPHLLKYIKATIRHCRVLSVLKVDYIDEEFLGLLTTLRKLHLNDQCRPGLTLRDFDRATLTGNLLLASLSKNCQQLTSLTLNQFNSSDAGILYLSLLPNLKTLHLICLGRVEGRFLKKLSKIEELKLLGCPAGDAEMIGVLENCRSLRSLSMADIMITDKTLAAAVRVASQRTDNIPLKIYCANTRANPKNFQGVSPLLEVFPDYFAL